MKLSNKRRKKLLVKQNGGFFSALIGPLADSASSLIGGLINRN
jgi:hypothetical protein